MSRVLMSPQMQRTSPSCDPRKRHSHRNRVREKLNAGFPGGKGPQSAEYRKLLETGKDKEPDSLLETPERNAALSRC